MNGRRIGMLVLSGLILLVVAMGTPRAASDPVVTEKVTLRIEGMT
jgi:hypothetical protein